MHKIKKIFIVLVIAFLFCNIFNSTYARRADAKGNPDGPSNSSKASINPDDYEPDELSESLSSSSMMMANKVIGAFQAIGSIVSVLALVLLGIKFALGSAEEKADYKQWMIYYVIGAILVFAISNISAMIYNSVNS